MAPKQKPTTRNEDTLNHEEEEEVTQVKIEGGNSTTSKDDSGSQKLDVLIGSFAEMLQILKENQDRTDRNFQKFFMNQIAPSNLPDSANGTPITPNLAHTPPAISSPTITPQNEAIDYVTNRQYNPKQTLELVTRPRLSELPQYSGDGNRLIPWLNDVASWPRKLGLNNMDDLLFRPGPPLALFLGGAALVWFENNLSSEPFHSFVDFQNRLLDCTHGEDWRSALERSIERRVERKETIDDYAMSLRQLVFVAYADHPRDEREEKLAATFARGLRDSVERMTCLAKLKENRKTPIEYLLSLVRQYRSASTHSTPLTVAALPLAPDPPRLLRDRKPSYRDNRCHRCNSSEHFFRDCPYEVVLRKSLQENDLVLTRNPEDEKKLPSGTKFIRALSVDQMNEESVSEEGEMETDTSQFYVRALATIQARDKPRWIKREIRVEIRLPWVEHPLLALFDFGAEVTVINSIFADGAKMLDESPPTVRDASNNIMPFVGVSQENLVMGNHSFPATVVWADLSTDAILGMDVIGPWMLTPRWSNFIFVSERDPSIKIPFVKVGGPSLNQYRLSLCPGDESCEEDYMFGPEDLPPAPTALSLLISPDLSHEDRMTLITPMEKFQVLFEGEDTRCNVFRHIISLTTPKPVHSAPRRVNPNRLASIQKQVDSMLSKNIISPSVSPYASPVLLVDKKNCTDVPQDPRFCVDYRRLNEVTVKDIYPLPAADDLLHSLDGCSYFAAFDLRSGFWQVEVDPNSRPLTAFTYPGGLYEFNVMPFGLCNAPATFQRLMDVVLGPLKYNVALVFLDDILVKGKSVQDLASNIEKVFERLEKANLRFNPKKVRVGFRQLIYLGHVVTDKGISPDPAKVQGIRDFPRPINFTDVRSFIGMVSYYRKFIPSLTNYSRPLEILGASKIWYWTDKEENAFQTCKEILTKEALLHYTNYELPLVIQTDASAVGLGAVLLQFDGDVEKPICYASRALSANESKYHARELECLAVKWALRRFRPIIEGYKVTVFTDHESLVWLMRQDVPQGRLARWVLELQGTDFSVVHRSGAQNRNVDALSRSMHVQKLCSLSLAGNPTDASWIEKFSLAQINDEHCKFWLDKAERSEHGYTIEEGVLCKKIKIRWQEWHAAVVPDVLRTEILRSYHSEHRAGHFGVQLTFEIIRRRFTWEGMRSDIKQWVKDCGICALTKRASGKRPGLMGVTNPERFNQLVCIDHVGPISQQKRKWILVMMDATTRWVEVSLVTSLSSKTTAKHFQNSWIYRYGAPDAILTDNGTAFEGPSFRKLLSDWQVAHHRTSPYHPQANPVERLHADLKRLVRAALEEESMDWENQIQRSAFCLRNKFCSSLKISPSELVLGIPMRMPLDITRSPQDTETDLESAQEYDRASREYRKQRYDRSRVEVTYECGDLVYVKRQVTTSSWDSPFIGPYRILKRVAPDAYHMRHASSGQVIRRHVNDIKPGVSVEERVDDVTIGSSV